MKRPMKTLDGNEAVAAVAYQVNEVAAIYPITPSSGMGEWMDQWASQGRKNIWGSVPQVVEMQSEAGAAGAVHGALEAGSVTTTFTASQGLLLMLPNMYKIAGELTPCVIHVAAREIATHALSIFAGHGDVMAARITGFAQLASNSVQEAMDLALIAQASTLASRVPFIHFFDGFRTSHEVAKIEMLLPEDIRAMIDDNLVRAHKQRALSPDNPFIRGTAQNPDVFFQGREAANQFFIDCPGIVQKTMDKFASIVGREYHLFDYVGAPDADRVIVIMGSSAEATEETVEYLNNHGEKVGLLKVRLFRPFSVKDFVQALPATVKKIGVLERYKESGSIGEPLYLDVVAAINEALAEGTAPFSAMPRVLGGRYGLSSKEFTPAMVKGVFDEMAKDKPRPHFTVGINDDVTRLSVDYDPDFSTEDEKTVRALFYGLGADGTVGANKNSIKIIGEDTDNEAQGYFVYDSRKSGATTVSHLRFGPKNIKSTYLISKASFIACHQFPFLEKLDMLSAAVKGATFLLNSPYGAEEVWEKLPGKVQQQIIAKGIKLYIIDALTVARNAGMGTRINTVMQTCFFAISGILPRGEAIQAIKASIKKTYISKGEAVVQKNWDAVDSTLENLYEVKVPATGSSQKSNGFGLPDDAPEFVKNVTAQILAGLGDELPVSAMPVDGTFPSGTTKYEKRNIGPEIPVWDESICIQCGKCSLVCPHAVIRGKVYDKTLLSGAPASFKSAEPKWKEFKDGMYFTLQVAPEDCTGCGLCVEACPVKNKSEVKLRAINMQPQVPLRDKERENWKFFESLPNMDRTAIGHGLVKNVQLLEPLFEFSGACTGCGETPYVKLMSQLFGDRAYVANATGCSSIYGGNLPTTPWTKNADGRGPAWSNSLFEDNAEFGMGMRVTVDTQATYAKDLVRRLRGEIGAELADALLSADQTEEVGINAQRNRVVQLKEKLAGIDSAEAKDLASLAHMLVKKSVWIFGGDGWAYDIGYGGLDHVIASGRNVNIVVLDTEVYSNTGGQCSKATPRGAVAKFAAGGKPQGKKDLAQMAMSYGTVYVAQVAFGANDAHTIKAFREAEAYDGPSLLICYSHCIAHGYNLVDGLSQQKAAVASGHWPLFRYHPEEAKNGRAALTLDSKAASIPLDQYIYNETRYKMLARSAPETAKKLLDEAQEDLRQKRRRYEYMAAMPGTEKAEDSAEAN